MAKKIAICKTSSKHLYDILDEILRHPAIDVTLNADDTIHLFFDGCCACDIKIENYTDLRLKESEE